MNVKLASEKLHKDKYYAYFMPNFDAKVLLPECLAARQDAERVWSFLARLRTKRWVNLAVIHVIQHMAAFNY